MKFQNKFALMLLAMIIQVAFILSPAMADRFYVALVIPLSGPAAERGEQIRKGFMLATTQRDAHADEESDGHLGNLDSYVRLINADGDVAAGINRLIGSRELNIVAAFTSDKTISLITRQLEGKKIVLLEPGQTPFIDKSLPAVTGFISDFKRAYGITPSASAAQGYNAARRLDTAVRAQDGVGNPDALQKNFQKTERNFMW